MACGIPCVATDSGDARELIGETGLVVPPRDPEALAAAWERLIELGPAGRRALGSAARAQIKSNYALAPVIARYEDLYEEIVARGLGAASVPRDIALRDSSAPQQAGR
jgi:glycosyltransferase involved in cell wall biosynthesis